MLKFDVHSGHLQEISSKLLTYCALRPTQPPPLRGMKVCGIISSCESATASEIVKRFWLLVCLMSQPPIQYPVLHIFTTHEAKVVLFSVMYVCVYVSLSVCLSTR